MNKKQMENKKENIRKHKGDVKKSLYSESPYHANAGYGDFLHNKRSITILNEVFDVCKENVS